MTNTNLPADWRQRLAALNRERVRAAKARGAPYPWNARLAPYEVTAADLATPDAPPTNAG